MQKTAQALYDSFKKNGTIDETFLEFTTKKIKAFGEGFRARGEQPIPTAQIVVRHLYDLDTGKQITFLNPDTLKVQSIVVPNDYVLNIIPPTKRKQLVEKQREHLIKDILRTLAFSGKVGSDPEIFVETGKGALIPAFEFLGSKKAPTLAARRKEHYEVGYGRNPCYWDGFQAEFSTTPSFCMGWHSDSIQCGLEGVWRAAKKYDKTAKLSIKTVFDIEPELLIESKPEHVQFGCMPSLNAYDMKGLDLPGHEVPFRPAGGHIHLSLTDQQFCNPNAYKRMVKAMDAILGVACVSMFANFDDPRRRQLYGLAGEYRLPPHGVEYRVLSNAWLFHPVIMNIVFDLARTAAMVGAHDALEELWSCPESETIRIINSCDVEGARKVLTENKEKLLNILDVSYYKSDAGGYRDKSEYAYNVIMNGMESVIKDVTDFEKNWSLSLDNEKWKRHCDGKGKNVLVIFEDGLQKKKV